jgi:hypothetical protein
MEMNAQANGIPTPQGVTQDNTFIYRVEPRVLLEEMRHNLMGEIFNPNNETWDKGNFPLLNQQGCDTIITIMRGKLNSAVVQGNSDQEMIYTICYQIKTNLIDLLYMRYEEFNCDFENWDTIVDLVDHAAFLFLTRTIEDKERQHHDSNVSYHESTITERPTQPENKSIRLPFIGGRK